MPGKGSRGAGRRQARRRDAPLDVWIFPDPPWRRRAAGVTFRARRPATSLVTNAATPFQATSLAAPFGGAANVAREGNGESGEKFTIIPLPAVPSTDYTAQRRGESIALTYQGRLQEAVDLYRGTVEADGWMCGILDTMSHGLLGLPLSFQGSPEMCSALLNADGTAGDYAAMHPGNECAKIFRDGLGLGFVRPLVKL